MAVSSHLDPLHGLAERWDQVTTLEQAKRFREELRRAGFDPSEELRRAGRKHTDVYRRLFGVPIPGR